LLALRRFRSRREGHCLSRLQCLISSIHHQDLCVATCSDGHWQWWCRWPACSSRGSASCLNDHLLVTYIIYKLFISTIISFFMVHIAYLETSPLFNVVFILKNLSRLTAPVSWPLTTSLRGEVLLHFITRCIFGFCVILSINTNHIPKQY
jgi:hypothetical protein